MRLDWGLTRQGAKRPPSPPSPALRPFDPSHQPRSVHLQNLLARQRHSSPPTAHDPFDAPVPNETYEQEGEGPRGAVGEGEGGASDEDMEGASGDGDENGHGG